ncbi:MAG: ATP-binding protein [Lachnospiraceae bacterium]|nr:ATP-binding protein [Lachnospiraceae bacterium]
MKRIERKEYLYWLIRQREKQIIKVVTGVRRCGKSTLFEIYRDYLLENGVEPTQIISLNFEDIEYEDLRDYKRLYEYVKERLVSDKMNYIFFDEIQHVEQYQKTVDSLFLRENCDVYITGSNAYFMSGELATLLTGRYAELAMMPLSFKEFCEGLDEDKKQLSLNEKFQRYITVGSFPYVLKYGYGVQEAKEYMQGIYHTILLNDVVKRLKISDVNMLEDVTRFMLFNIGNRTSPTTIANTMTSKQKKIDPKTVDRYIRGLTDSLLFYEARRYNIRGKEFLSTMNKYYAADMGMRNMLVQGSSSDVGHILENLVYLELKRRGFEVYVGQLGTDGEIDFVTMKDGKLAYYQVAASTLDEEVLKRELAPLNNIKYNYPKYLLTLDELFEDINYDGVQKLNALKWFLED